MTPPPLIQPKFRTTADWQLAQVLIQPALIRIIDNLQTFLQASDWTGEFAMIETPEPGHLLILRQDGAPEQQVLLWDLCFRVCFTDYPPATAEPPWVTLETEFLEADGEIAWAALDEKVNQVLHQFFAQLPPANHE
ncbi:MAG: hypothetical protein AAGG51_13435 [Cyanobacteria bacterium P01_G01_bin.54]